MRRPQSEPTVDAVGLCAFEPRPWPRSPPACTSRAPGATEAASLKIRQVVPDQTRARWAAQLAPAVAIEATIAGLDAGQPDPEHAAARIRRVVIGVVEAAVATDPTASLPASEEGQGNEWNGCQGV